MTLPHFYTKIDTYEYSYVNPPFLILMGSMEPIKPMLWHAKGATEKGLSLKMTDVKV